MDAIVLQLDSFCIETTARRLYQQWTSQLLDDDQDESALADKMELLRTFLEQEDFRAIRAQDQDLSGHAKARVKIYRDQDKRVRWAKL